MFIECRKFILSDSLFDTDKKTHKPLADRMRPKTLDEYIGQENIIGKGRLLRRAIQSDRLSSIILYGPPGTGKTTLAKIIANHTKSNFQSLNAVLAGIQQIRDAIKTAEENKRLYERKTILFVDEVHRWNKSQQDALLPWVENGTVIFIGATTENPFFEVNKALVSRSRVFKLELLSETELMKAAKAALANCENGYGKWQITFEDGALEHLVKTASGDARSLLNALELAVETTPEKWPLPTGEKIFISKEVCEQSIQQKVVLYDADGDYHYDVISAFIKSIRGSDVDAALYWLAKMVCAGESPHFIFRRLLISACEDVGMANPNAISVVASCLQAFDAVGLPEGQYHLAHATIYLATSPKSNSALGFFDAIATVRAETTEVPKHLRDANRDKSLGDGEGYLYPHQYREHWVAQQYLPDNLVGKIFYKPSSVGYEKDIAGEVLGKREAQLADFLERTSNSSETLFGDSFENANQKSADFFLDNTISNRKEILQLLKKTIIHEADLNATSRVFVFRADNNLLLWEINRIADDAVTCGLCKTEKAKAILEKYAKSLDDFKKPFLQVAGSADFSDYEFDVFTAYFPYTDEKELKDFFEYVKKYSATNYRIVFAVQNLQQGLRLAELLPLGNEAFDTNLIDKFRTEENDFFRHKFSFCKSDIINIAETYAYNMHCKTFEAFEKRVLSEAEIESWFSTQSEYGSAMHNYFSEDELLRIQAKLHTFAKTRQEITYKTEINFFTFYKGETKKSIQNDKTNSKITDTESEVLCLG